MTIVDNISVLFCVVSSYLLLPLQLGLGGVVSSDDNNVAYHARAYAIIILIANIAPVVHYY